MIVKKMAMIVMVVLKMGDESGSDGGGDAGDEGGGAD
jgi:hypothetical protein